MSAWGAKTIVLEHTAQVKFDAALLTHDRFEDAFFGLEWLLARRASLMGQARIGSKDAERVYVCSGDEIANAPDIWVLFSDQANQVVIWDINIVKREDDTV